MGEQYEKDLKSFLILIAALLLLSAFAILVPTTLRAQVPAFRALEEVREEREKSGATAVEDPAQSENGSGFKGREHERKLMLRQLPPSERAQRPRLQDWLFWLAAFYGITLVERLYKTAVRHELNRALWPILGLVLNLFALPLLLVALCDPKRAQKQV